jgi:hypothetical protein
MAMRRRLWKLWLPAVGASGLLMGCEHSQATRYPPDPLLLSKKPVEVRPEPGPLRVVARHEPPAPEGLEALASLGPEEKQHEPVSAIRATVPRAETDEP